tara:strand:- start:120 stop:743 length:624 start_codon:yes stop_codon:yes gene_type:complete
MINLYNADCLSAMLEMADNQFDLAIVDPPYGIKQAKGISFGKWKRDIHKEKTWDDRIPSKQYFDELKRVSKNQIIWGGNYFLDYLSNTRCMLVWDKNNGTNPMSDCELAWTSFDSSVRKYKYNHIQDYNAGIDRIHPTQKPISLYTWILQKYAKEGDTILDTHLGSGSIAIACHDMGFDLTAYEIDEEYFAAASNRLKQHQRQLKLF